jgi:hypothetical protein
MGIDIYLRWDGMTKEEEQQQYTGFSVVAGNVGYLREAYHGGPYATKILVREAFESEDGTAEIPASVMRARLTSVTEPARVRDGQFVVDIVCPAGTRPNRTDPQSVHEAICMRYGNEPPEFVKDVVQSFNEFVALAAEKEKATKKPCRILASY